MGEILSVVTRKGQITLPIEIRRSLDIKVGDKVALSIDNTESTVVILRPVRSVAELTFGAVEPRKQPEDFGEFRRRFEEGAAEQVTDEETPTVSR